MKIVLYRFDYRKNDVKKYLNNSVTYNNAIFKKGTSYRDPVITIDVGASQTLLIPYNYAYIEELNQRYYFISKIYMLTDRIYELHLHVDVLYSYIGKDNAPLRNQNVFINRNEFNFNKLIEDDRINYEYRNEVSYKELVNTGSAAITLLNIDDNSRNVLVSVVLPYNTDTLIDGTDESTNAYYPDVQDYRTIPRECTNFNVGTITYILTYGQARELAFRCLTDDQLASNIRSFVIFPFELRESSGLNYQLLNNTGKYYIGITGVFQFTNSVSQAVYVLKSSLINKVMFTCPDLSEYMKAEDDFEDSFLEYNKHSKYEIFVPYIGWVDIDRSIIKPNDRIMIKLTGEVDIFEGTVTMYLNGIPYKSMRCKIGCQVALSTTNAYENAQRENAILTQEIGSSIIGALTTLVGVGLVASGYGAGAGVAMIAGGLGTIAGSTFSSISQAMQIFDYTQKGTSTKIDGLFSLQKFIMRITRQVPVAEAYSSAFVGENGRPSYMMEQISNLRGYTEFGKCEFNVGNIEDEEELETLTQNGVHFPPTSW